MVCAFALTFAALSAPAAAQTASPTTFITLGTGSGPMGNPKRSQPAHLLRAGDQTILIDAGDGATEQLVKAGVAFGEVQTILISHLHTDHIGGLFAFVGRRYQASTRGVVTIYGPVGTKALIAGFIASLEPVLASWPKGRRPILPSETVRVIEIGDGWEGTIGVIKIRAVANSHYALLPDGPDNEGARTLAFRFDTPGKSIAFTGDTGPSAAVEKLADSVDLLFSEIMDPDAALAELKTVRPDMPASALAAIEAHFRAQHLSPLEVGLMAKRAGVKTVVLVHNAIAENALAAAKVKIGENFPGIVIFARDLESF